MSSTDKITRRLPRGGGWRERGPFELRLLSDAHWCLCTNNKGQKALVEIFPLRPESKLKERLKHHNWVKPLLFPLSKYYLCITVCPKLKFFSIRHRDNWFCSPDFAVNESHLSFCPLFSSYCLYFYSILSKFLDKNSPESPWGAWPLSLPSQRLCCYTLGCGVGIRIFKSPAPPAPLPSILVFSRNSRRIM